MATGRPQVDELSERLARLQPFKDRARTEFDRDPWMKELDEFARLIRDWLHRRNAPVP